MLSKHLRFTERTQYFLLKIYPKGTVIRLTFEIPEKV
jgi:hypothetical protein